MACLRRVNIKKKYAGVPSGTKTKHLDATGAPLVAAALRSKGVGPIASLTDKLSALARYVCAQVSCAAVYIVTKP